MFRPTPAIIRFSSDRALVLYKIVAVMSQWWDLIMWYLLLLLLRDVAVGGGFLWCGYALDWGASQASAYPPNTQITETPPPTTATSLNSNNNKCHRLWGTAVAQWLRCCATNRKVAGSIPTSVSGFFIDIKSFRSHYGPGVDSASNRNEYQEHFLVINAAGV